jgi:hypothetical protein
MVRQCARQAPPERALAGNGGPSDRDNHILDTGEASMRPQAANRRATTGRPCERGFENVLDCVCAADARSNLPLPAGPHTRARSKTHWTCKRPGAGRWGHLGSAYAARPDGQGDRSANWGTHMPKTKQPPACSLTITRCGQYFSAALSAARLLGLRPCHLQP